MHEEIGAALECAHEALRSVKEMLSITDDQQERQRLETEVGLLEVTIAECNAAGVVLITSKPQRGDGLPPLLAS